MTSLKISSAFVLATLAAMAAPGFAAAANSSTTPGVEIHGNSILEVPALPGRPNPRVQLTGQVHFGDLNLNRTQDVITLRDRVAQSAEQICAKLDQSFRGLLTNPEYGNAQCVRDAVDGAQSQINQAVAASLAAQRSG